MNAFAREFKRHAKIGLLPFLLAFGGLVALGFAVSFLMAWAVSEQTSDAIWFFALMSVALIFGWGSDQLTELQT